MQAKILPPIWFAEVEPGVFAVGLSGRMQFVRPRADQLEVFRLLRDAAAARGSWIDCTDLVMAWDAAHPRRALVNRRRRVVEVLCEYSPMLADAVASAQTHVNPAGRIYLRLPLDPDSRSLATSLDDL